MHDLHIHTHHSCDSKATLDSYCKKAIELGLTHICFTDHIDYNKADYGYGYYNSQSFFDELNSVSDKYSSKLNILCGVEFSEPHIYKKEFEAFQRMPYDFILGSIHFWIDNLFPSEMIKHNISVELAFEKYWQEVYAAVSFGGFDSLAHLDFPKRYYKQLLYSDNYLKTIFSKMTLNNIALEINTSTLRQGHNESMPDKNILDIYNLSGGKYITFGSDAHIADDLAAGYSHAQSLIADMQLQSVIYVKRKPIILSIDK